MTRTFHITASEPVRVEHTRTTLGQPALFSHTDHYEAIDHQPVAAPGDRDAKRYLRAPFSTPSDERPYSERPYSERPYSGREHRTDH